MLRSAALWRAVLNRSRADWPVVLAAWLLLTCATTLPATGAIYGDAARPWRQGTETRPRAAFGHRHGTAGDPQPPSLR